MTDGLKPCPFCGSQAELYDYADADDSSAGHFRAMDDSDVAEALEANEDGLFSIFCTGCLATMNHEGLVKDIIAGWNRRETHD